MFVAAPEPVLEAIVTGAAAAGLDVTAASHASLWLVRGHAQALVLSASPGIEFLFACAAASASAPSLSLLPATIVHSRRQALRRSRNRWALAAAVSAVSAIGSYLGALEHQAQRATRELARLQTSVAHAGAIRRDLDQANAALAFLELGAGRPTQRVGVLASLTRALPAGAFLSSFRVDGSGRVTLSVFAPRAAAVLSNLDNAGLGRAVLEGSITREIVSGREYDRFRAVLVPDGSRAQ